ncbi:hypothetical protein LVD17_07210 [Fulvivirga ulvae]|uniref:hypothetical protein n=1 Tax=Fulvivirga ulvae TaxID=2904245 RepID=UPI001F2B8264|nr:hypothetical protein [Fulvivirga ulvae]UII33606.1 hypothetical protein LVD17_07210 [Fulvivirga ulvae]
MNSDYVVSTGLLEGLKDEIERIKRLGIHKVIFENDAKNVSLDPNKTIILFRMFQEVLNNTLKHSNATCISVIQD